MPNKRSDETPNSAATELFAVIAANRSSRSAPSQSSAERAFTIVSSVVKLFEALETETVDGVRTITARRMSSPKDGSFTEVWFADIAYDVGLEDDLFQERYMKSPPRDLVKE